MFYLFLFIDNWLHMQLINFYLPGWWSGVVVSMLALINKVNQRRAQLVLGWVTVSGNSWAGHLFRYVTTSHTRPTQLSIPSGSVNEYQLWLGRPRQVWFIPLTDERGVCR